MKIKLNNVFVDNQDKALKFYTEVLGFVKDKDVPVGEFKWLTVKSPDDPQGGELLLEPDDNPAAKAYQTALHQQGIPAIAFEVADTHKEFERLKALGVKFTQEPMPTGPTIIAVFDDTCGNLVQIYQG